MSLREAARVSFIMDRVMHGMGLHGKSFIPLLIGFGCKPSRFSPPHLALTFSNQRVII
jgi:hypothetical protein